MTQAEREQIEQVAFEAARDIEHEVFGNDERCSQAYIDAHRQSLSPLANDLRLTFHTKDPVLMRKVAVAIRSVLTEEAKAQEENERARRYLDGRDLRKERGRDW